MAKHKDIEKVLIIGSGPIIIGQACEFDYSGTQACKALRSMGYKIILVNSNPATIMTDPEMADVTYIEALNEYALTEIIKKERPDALLPNLGGQTGLNLSLKKKKQESINQQLRLNKLNAELTLLKVKSDKQIIKERHVLSDLEKIKYRISKSTANAKKFTQGMTKNDIIKIAGRPLSEDSCNSSVFLNYGQYWAYLQSGVFKKLVSSRVYEGPCNVKLYSKVTHNLH